VPEPLNFSLLHDLASGSFLEIWSLFRLGEVYTMNFGIQQEVAVKNLAAFGSRTPSVLMGGPARAAVVARRSCGPARVGA
jgi:hypothetical protein